MEAAGVAGFVGVVEDHLLAGILYCARQLVGVVLKAKERSFMEPVKDG